MRLRRGLHCIASGRVGFNLTDPFDCSVFAFDSGEGWVVFDAGSGRDLTRIVEVCRADGIAPEDIRWLCLTHCHGDHAGGVAGWHEVSRVEVLAHPATAATVRTADERSMSLDVARIAGIYPKDYVVRPGAVDRELADGEVLRLGRLAVTVLATPGHCRDHMAYLVEDGDQRLLLSGDALFSGGRISLQNIWDCSVQDSCATVLKLASLEFDALLPGHSEVHLADGRRHAEIAADYVRRLVVPPQL
jgi:glyoxylase-like metal-dependent hydrolase (beta-lactamase superfamily II)